MSIRLMIATVALLCSGAALADVKAIADIHAADGAARGTAKAHKARDGIEINATITGLAPGVYAIHVHPIGKCEGPDFASAGTHWNPLGHQHGTANPDGPHMGDLPNVTVKANGVGHINGHLKGASMQGGANPLLDADGSSILLHAHSDDYSSQPSGGSGPKIACGVFVAK